MENIKTIELVTSKDNLLDYTWLFKNIPWANFDNQNAKLTFDEPIELYCIEIDGSDTQIKELKKVTFDNVIITSYHGNPGNTFLFEFKIGDDLVFRTYDYRSFAYSLDDVKTKYISKLDSKINFLNWQINNNKKAIEKILSLTI